MRRYGRDYYFSEASSRDIVGEREAELKDLIGSSGVDEREEVGEKWDAPSDLLDYAIFVRGMYRRLNMILYVFTGKSFLLRKDRKGPGRMKSRDTMQISYDVDALKNLISVVQEIMDTMDRKRIEYTRVPSVLFSDVRNVLSDLAGYVTKKIGKKVDIADEMDRLCDEIDDLLTGRIHKEVMAYGRR